MNIMEHESVASEWLSGIDLGGRIVTVEIAGVEEVTVSDRTGRTIRKVAVSFRSAKKRLLLNATNAKALAKLFGLEMTTGQGRASSCERRT